MVELLELASEDLAVLFARQFLVVDNLFSDLAVVQVVQIQLVLVAVLASQDEAIVHVDTVSANVDAHDWLASNHAGSHVPDKYLSVPSTGDNQVRLVLDILGADDSV